MVSLKSPAIRLVTSSEYHLVKKPESLSLTNKESMTIHRMTDKLPPCEHPLVTPNLILVPQIEASTVLPLSMILSMLPDRCPFHQSVSGRLLYSFEVVVVKCPFDVHGTP